MRKETKVGDAAQKGETDLAQCGGKKECWMYWRGAMLLNPVVDVGTVITVLKGLL